MSNALNITVTDTARARMEELAGDGFIRLSIKSTGCSGHSYAMVRADGIGGGDDSVVVGAATLLIAKTHSWMMIGMTIDYVETDLVQEFTFTNPNEKGRCGCGESFSL